MSFAVLQTGGKQYKVKAGEIIKIEKLKDSKPDTKIEFKEILAYGDEKNLELGSPMINGAKVEAELIKNSKNYSKDGTVISEAEKKDKVKVSSSKEKIQEKK